jgi:hypothetical protein
MLGIPSNAAICYGHAQLVGASGRPATGPRR